MLSKVVREPGVCWGQWNGRPCPMSGRAHERGRIDAFGLIHFSDRQFNKRAAKRLLMLVAKRTREGDARYLNNEMFDWLYVYMDSVVAQKSALYWGFRLPARLFEQDRQRALQLAARRSVSVRRYPGFKSWLFYQ